MIVYSHKFFDALDDEERKMDREESEERKKLERERKKNIENRTKYNTFLSNYENPGTSWGRDKAKRIAKELDKKGYSDEEILDEASSTPLLDNATGNGAAIGVGIGSLSSIGTELYRKLKKGHFSPDGPNVKLALAGGIVGGAVGNIGARIKRKEAVRELLEQRRKDEEERRRKK